ncbi:MAG: sulfoxide reductase heme-binding subunit YedZ [Deltaproteobacteria bacterium]|nr:sulfoxide reductase heme-binding subunit YedZ [Deltaproteobacteria bacterium]
MNRDWLPRAVLAGIGVPLGILAARACAGLLGANPIATALNQLGLLSLALLVASLTCTPLRLVTGASFPMRIRRTLGLAAFFCGVLHALVYLALDQGLAWRALVKDAVARPFIALGVAALLAMVPLAVTSTRRAQQRLGGRRWRRLHRLAYLAGALAVGHYLLRVKADVTEPALYGTVVALGFAARLIRGRSRRSGTASERRVGGNLEATSAREEKLQNSP